MRLSDLKPKDLLLGEALIALVLQCEEDSLHCDSNESVRTRNRLLILRTAQHQDVLEILNYDAPDHYIDGLAVNGIFRAGVNMIPGIRD